LLTPYFAVIVCDILIRQEVFMKRTRIAPYLALFASMLLAQQTLTNESVMKLVKAGMGDDLIINMINTQPSNFSVATDDLIALKTGGASEKVIAAILLKNTGGAPAQVASSAAGPVNEIGVYYKKAGAWIDMEPEVVNFKTGGVLKSIATEGIVKGDINGHIKGAHSKTETTTPIELLIYVPEGVAATEYQLLHLHEQATRESSARSQGAFSIDIDLVALAGTLSILKPRRSRLVPTRSLFQI
jgi:hypothetical protein